MIKKIMTPACGIAAALLLTSNAMAAGKSYVGANYTSVDYDADSVAEAI